MTDLLLIRDHSGRLALHTAEGLTRLRVVPLFPLTRPEGPFSLVDDEGREQAFYSGLSDLPSECLELVRAELRWELFRPKISAVLSVSSFDFPSRWRVRTERGDVELKLASEDCFRRLGRFSLLIHDDLGLEVLVSDYSQLDKTSRQILERFL